MCSTVDRSCVSLLLAQIRVRMISTVCSYSTKGNILMGWRIAGKQLPDAAGGVVKGGCREKLLEVSLNAKECLPVARNY